VQCVASVLHADGGWLCICISYMLYCYTTMAIQYSTAIHYTYVLEQARSDEARN
jgi:hypothetical protein